MTRRGPTILLTILVLAAASACTQDFIAESGGRLETQPVDRAHQLPPAGEASPLPTIGMRTVTPSPTKTPGAALTPTFVLPTLTPYPDDEHFSIGTSVEGRSLWAWQFGEGRYSIVLVGGIHGGFEGNTVVLAEELVDYFRSNPGDVLPSVRLVIIPAANPDGLVRGSEIEGRFNARGVDLNRNWGCEWSDTAVLRDVEVDPGPRPFSEPETFALRAYFIAESPDAVIFYHSAAGGIFLGQCGEHPAAVWLGELLEEATGYPHHETFEYYEVSGDATNWLAERGIPAAVVETYTKEETDFDINLAGVMALQCHFAMLDENGHALDKPPDPATARLCDREASLWQGGES